VPDRGDLAQALDATEEFVRRYVVFGSPEQATAAALWVAHSWMYDQFDTTPYLAVQSAERRSGKTRCLECLRLLVREPLPVAGTSLAALFRVVNDRHPTVLMDEADTTFSRRKSDTAEDLRGLLNNGYRRGTPYLRVVGEGKRMHVASFDCFCPKAVASIGRLPDTVEDRAIVIQLRRRARSEPVEPFRFRTAERQATPVREWWEALATMDLPDEATVPAELHDRAADNWEPLMAVADAAGGEWPAAARRAALVLSGVVDIEDERPGVRLLGDLRELFGERATERVATRDLLEALHGERFEESGWSDWHDRGLKAEGLAWLLRPFGIRPRLMKIAGTAARGFEVADFADAFARYLPADTPPTRYPVTDTHESTHAGNGVTSDTGPAGKGTRWRPGRGSRG
jgi:hypothetical protein